MAKLPERQPLRLTDEQKELMDRTWYDRTESGYGKNPLAQAFLTERSITERRRAIDAFAREHGIPAEKIIVSLLNHMWGGWGIENGHGTARAAMQLVKMLPRQHWEPTHASLFPRIAEWLNRYPEYKKQTPLGEAEETKLSSDMEQLAKTVSHYTQPHGGQITAEGEARLRREAHLRVELEALKHQLDELQAGHELDAQGWRTHSSGLRNQLETMERDYDEARRLLEIARRAGTEHERNAQDLQRRIDAALEHVTTVDAHLQRKWALTPASKAARTAIRKAKRKLEGK